MRRGLMVAAGAMALAFPGAAVARGGADDGPNHDAGDDHGGATQNHRHGDHQGEDSKLSGTIVSFTGGVLTLKRSDGSTVSGRVNGSTDIECSDDDHRGDRGRHRGHGRRDDNRCNNADLVAGGTVRKAELRTGGTLGARFSELDLS